MNRRTSLAFSPGAAGPLLQGDLSWQDRGLCAEVAGDLFFPEKGGSTREAKRVCRACEVRAECLDYALENDERFGIWGGMSERERRRLKRTTVADDLPAERRCLKGLHVMTDENTIGSGSCRACKRAADRLRGIRGPAPKASALGEAA